MKAATGTGFTGGLNSSWQWGAPQKTIINKAANGNNCWVTNLTGDYNSNELSYLYSPCFDLSSLTSPELSFSHIFQTEDDCACDYHWAEYSLNDTTWIRLGAAGSGVNWYDDATNQTWQMSYTKWHVSSYDIPVTASRVRFRIVMSSDPATTYEGVGIDDIHIFDKASVYKGANDSLAQPVSGANWINFAIGGNLMAAINPNGQDLGLTNVKVFFNHTGTVRNNNAEYYLDRNIVIQPSNQPSGHVGVRFYFLDSEAVNLINATGCTGCTTIADAYQSGVTQFSSPNSAEEDSTLNNDTSGVFVFHVPHTDVSIIPNDNGYYAEYQVKDFSEFWINNGGPLGSLPPPATTLSFMAVRTGDNALLQWSTTNAITLSRFIIEKSTDSIHFTVLDSVAATADGNTVDAYQYTDTHLVEGLNYYRLREVDQDGLYTWSPVRSVDGSAAGDITIRPNPARKYSNLFINSSVNTREIRLTDVSGKTILLMETRGNLNTLPLGRHCQGHLLCHSVYGYRQYGAKDTHSIKKRS